MNKASEDGPPPSFFGKVTADPGLNLPDSVKTTRPFILLKYQNKNAGNCFVLIGNLLEITTLALKL